MKKGIRILFLSTCLVGLFSSVAAYSPGVEVSATKVEKAASILDAKEFNVELLAPVSIVYFEAPAEILPVVAVISHQTKAFNVKQVLNTAERVRCCSNSLLLQKNGNDKLYLKNCSIRQCTGGTVAAVKLSRSNCSVPWEMRTRSC